MNKQIIWLSIPFICGVGCDDSTATVDARCEIEVIQPEESLSPGDTVTLQAYPLSSVIDTTLLLNDLSVEILSIDINTTSCVECSSCREAEFCTTCGFCATCTVECADCLHDLEFELPETIPAASEYLITIVNGFGSSSPIDIELRETDENE